MGIPTPFDSEWLYVEILEISKFLAHRAATSPRKSERSAVYASIAVMLEDAIQTAHKRAAAVN
jgi:hypothetical protein